MPWPQFFDFPNLVDPGVVVVVVVAVVAPPADGEADLFLVVAIVSRQLVLPPWPTDHRQRLSLAFLMLPLPWQSSLKHLPLQRPHRHCRHYCFPHLPIHAPTNSHCLVFYFVVAVADGFERYCSYCCCESHYHD